MHAIFFLMRIYPYWAFPMALAMGQIAIHCRRRHSKAQYPMAVVMVLFILTGLFWIVMRGDLHAERWIRAIIDFF